ncbi:hypothetical protein [Lentibacillus salinarum]|uniref:Secreted protein n=1 Tax=Lentibacillus salinarum TaxID=446820 RepID=A0ABW3ZW58_9BACI
MKHSILMTFAAMIVFVSSLTETAAQPTENEQPDGEQHNWGEYSTHYETIDARSHEYTYWKNFIERTRTCDISHKIKSVVYYCDVHDHTDTEIFLEEIIHSEEHE